MYLSTACVNKTLHSEDNNRLFKFNVTHHFDKIEYINVDYSWLLAIGHTGRYREIIAYNTRNHLSYILNALQS